MDFVNLYAGCFNQQIIGLPSKKQDSRSHDTLELFTLLHYLWYTAVKFGILAPINILNLPQAMRIHQLSRCLPCLSQYDDKHDLSSSKFKNKSHNQIMHTLLLLKLIPCARIRPIHDMFSTQGPFCSSCLGRGFAASWAMPPGRGDPIHSLTRIWIKSGSFSRELAILIWITWVVLLVLYLFVPLLETKPEEPSPRGCHHRSCRVNFPVQLTRPFFGSVYLFTTIQTIWPEHHHHHHHHYQLSNRRNFPPVPKCLVHASIESWTQLQRMQRWKLHLHGWGDENWQASGESAAANWVVGKAGGQGACILGKYNKSSSIKSMPPHWTKPNICTEK